MMLRLLRTGHLYFQSKSSIIVGIKNLNQNSNITDVSRRVSNLTPGFFTLTIENGDGMESKSSYDSSKPIST